MSAAKIVLLCEDEQMACFARRFLKRRGLTARDIREEKAPPGKGSAEQWVRNRYPIELKAYRDEQADALLILTDADRLSVEERLKTLADECLKENVPQRRPEEQVILVVPDRNIETWLAYLRGQDVDNTTVYEKYKAEADCRNEVKVLDEMCRKQRLREPAPESLVRACEEFKRFG